MRRVILFFIGLFAVCALSASRVDTLEVKSKAMKGKTVKVLFIVPDAAFEADSPRFPVIYLLHGYGGHAFTWITIRPGLKEISDRYDVIFACPDGKSSWYWDSPLNEDSRYETFISSELPAFTDSRYPTIADRKGRAITGLSMGGHGSLWNAIRHQDVFGAAGSVSGGVDIRPFPDSWKMKEQLGERDRNKQRWDDHTVMTQLDKLTPGALAINFCCGVDDFFYEVNCNLHDELVRRKIPHDFTSRPGAHTLEYWANAIDYHLLFFLKYFKGAE